MFFVLKNKKITNIKYFILYSKLIYKLQVLIYIVVNMLIYIMVAKLLTILYTNNMVIIH